MKVIIRYPKRRELTVKGGRPLGDILKDLRLNPETVVVVQGQTLLTSDAHVADEARIEIFSAISGGQALLADAPGAV